MADQETEIVKADVVFIAIASELKKILRNPAEDLACTIRALKLAVELGPFGSSLIGLLVKIIEEFKGEYVSVLAVNSLASIGDSAQETIPLLGEIMLTYDSYPNESYLHYAAADALGFIRSEKSIQFLMRSISISDPEGPGWRSVVSLANYGPQARQAIPILVDIFYKPEFSDMRISILNTLGKIGPSNGQGWALACDVLNKYGKQNEEDLLVAAAEALYDLLFADGDMPLNSKEIMQTLVAYDNETIRDIATSALEHIDEVRE